MFSSIFDTYHVAPILCCTTTDLGIFLCKTGFFGSVLGIFGVAFVGATDVPLLYKLLAQYGLAGM